MPCTNCIQTTSPITGFNPAGCFSAPSCGQDASCIIYTGPNLSCSGVNTNDALDVILQKIDPILCGSGGGDYSSYNTFCLAPITTQKQFVETISSFVCTTRTDLDTFIGTTFPAYQSSVSSILTAINTPGILCTAAGVGVNDTLATILAKYCTAITNITSNLAMSEVNWSSCYTVSPAPTTLTQAFNVLIGQICLLKSQVASAAVLPTFNNTANCLAGGAADTLVQTITSMITRLCQTPTLNNSLISWGCLSQPAGNQDLNTALLNIVGKINVLTMAFPSVFSSDFTVTNVDNTNLCLGKHIALATPSTQDRFVAATTSDTSPGTLQAKVTPGTGIALDFTTTPGQMIINNTGGVGGGDHKVLADSGDTTAGYLIDKIEFSPSVGGIGLTATLDTGAPSNHLVNFSITLDGVTLMTALLNAVSTNTALQTLFCQTVASCPSPCSAPTNVTITYSPGTTTTTTTSTSTTSTTTTTTTT